jgi:hypothetical protein
MLNENKVNQTKFTQWTITGLGTNGQTNNGPEGPENI